MHGYDLPTAIAAGSTGKAWVRVADSVRRMHRSGVCVTDIGRDLDKRGANSKVCLLNSNEAHAGICSVPQTRQTFEGRSSKTTCGEGPVLDVCMSWYASLSCEMRKDLRNVDQIVILSCSDVYNVKMCNKRKDLLLPRTVFKFFLVNAALGLGLVDWVVKCSKVALHEKK